MTPEFTDIHKIFNDAILLESENQRSRYLDQVCGGNQDLRQRVNALLKAHAEAGAFFGGSPLATKVHEPVETTSQMIGPYKLREQIGEGGFGVVYVAEQKAPVSRKVALKVIKPGMDSKDIIARFEAERQALAMMDHPNVAKVLDAGATESGRPYFVMELVHGVAITGYCDSRKLTTRQRLELFIDVCHAVQHAHQKGIIHRDLKPSNVMVTMADHRPVVKVIDFGVAKALHHDLTEKSIYTAYGQMIGTPMYMSPEQAQLSSLDVDTRSDIYSLGVLLYELLTGTTPFDKEVFRNVGFDEMRRMIREVEPRRPSDRVSTLKAEQISTISHAHSIDQRSLSRTLRGDLDWIVMKALEKDRTRRYETAKALADDVQRYRSNEPVVACPPTTLYRCRKFARRNRVGVAFVTLSLLFLVAGGTGLAISNRNLTRSKNATLAALEMADSNLKNANQANQKAQQRLSQLLKSNDVLASVIDDINIEEIAESSEPLEEVLAQRLVIASSQMTGDIIGDPLIVADMQMKLGNSILSLGFPDRALVLFEASCDTRSRLLGPRDPISVISMIAIGRALVDAGRFENATDQLEQSLDAANATLGPDDPDTLRTLIGLAAAYRGSGHITDAIRVAKEATDRCLKKLGTRDRLTLKAQSELAVCYLDAAEPEYAIPLLEETNLIRQKVFGPYHPEVFSNVHNLAGGYKLAGRYDEALQLLEPLLELKRIELGPSHPSTISTMSNLGLVYLEHGQVELATSTLRKAMELSEVRSGIDHPRTLGIASNLGRSLQVAGRHDEALLLFSKTSAFMKRKLGVDHPKTLACMNNLANSYLGLGQIEKAIPVLEECAELRLVCLPDHPDTLTTMANLGRAYLSINKLDKGIELLEHALHRQREKLGEKHSSTLASMANLASGYHRAGRFRESIDLSEEALRVLNTRFGADHPHILSIQGNLASVYWSLDQLDKSIELFEMIYKQQLAKYGQDHPSTVATMANLGVNYKDAGRLAEAISFLEDVYARDDKTGVMLWVAKPLIDAYVKSGRLDDAAKVLEKFLCDDRNRWPSDSINLAKDLTELCNVYYLPLEKYIDAESLLREALVIQESAIPDQLPVFYTQLSLGEALLGQSKYKEAEMMLLGSYQGLLRHKATTRPRFLRIDDALNNLVLMYERWNHDMPDADLVNKATKWRRELEQHKRN